VPEKMHIIMSSLKSFNIIDYLEVELLFEGGFASKLEVIYVKNCEKLFAGRMRWSLQTMAELGICPSRSGIKIIKYNDI
jgi:hypothetical protein